MKKLAVILGFIFSSAYGQDSIDYNYYDITKKKAISIKTKKLNNVIEYSKSGYNFYFDYSTYMEYLKKSISEREKRSHVGSEYDKQLKKFVADLELIKSDTVSINIIIPVEGIKNITERYITELCLKKRVCLKAQNSSLPEKRILVYNYKTKNKEGCVIRGKFILTKETKRLLLDLTESRTMVRSFAE